MIIVYAAVAGQSVVKLYASAMFPGFFLALLYLIYILGWALISPKIAPKVEAKVPVSEWVRRFQAVYSRNMLVGLAKSLVSPARARTIDVAGQPIGYGLLVKNFLAALFPVALAAVTLWGIWWYVVIHPMEEVEAPKPVAAAAPAQAAAQAQAAPQSSLSEPPAPMRSRASSEPGCRKRRRPGPRKTAKRRRPLEIPS
jgi:TRAP-type mannitol/chloroaromatic compound transport system permease large subunit